MRKLLFTSVGSMFLVLAVIEISNGTTDPVCLTHCMLYFGGAIFAFLTLVPRFHNIVLHSLLVLSALTMTAFFALFFIHDSSINYLTSSLPGISLHLMFLLMSAFCMATVVAHYSCRAKVGGCQSYFEDTPSYSSSV